MLFFGHIEPKQTKQTFVAPVKILISICILSDTALYTLVGVSICKVIVTCAYLCMSSYSKIH